MPDQFNELRNQKLCKNIQGRGVYIKRHVPTKPLCRNDVEIQRKAA
jgi:hypothetical protein